MGTRNGASIGLQWGKRKKDGKSAREVDANSQWRPARRRRAPKKPEGAAQPEKNEGRADRERR